MPTDVTEIDFPQPPSRSCRVNTADLLRVHPTPPPAERLDVLAACVKGCYGSAESCTLCADACLGERAVADLTSCIRQCLDCAAICEATARVIARQTASRPELQRRQIEACIAACEYVRRGVRRARPDARPLPPVPRHLLGMRGPVQGPAGAHVSGAAPGRGSLHPASPPCCLISFMPFPSWRFWPG